MALQLVHCKLPIICPTYPHMHALPFCTLLCVFVFKVGKVCSEHCAMLTGSLSPDFSAENSTTLCCQGRSFQGCRVPCGQGSTSQQQRWRWCMERDWHAFSSCMILQWTLAYLVQDHGHADKCMKWSDMWIIMQIASVVLLEILSLLLLKSGEYLQHGGHHCSIDTRVKWRVCIHIVVWWNLAYLNLKYLAAQIIWPRSVSSI